MKVWITRWLIPLGLVITSCEQHNVADLDRFSDSQLVEWNRNLTDVIIADIFTPPVASRIYAYPNIAAYEAVQSIDANYKSLAGRLKGLGPCPEPKNDQPYYLPMASVVAFTTVAKELVWNKDRINDLEASYLEEIQNVGINKRAFQVSYEYGQEVGNHILEWAGRDGYNRRTANANYTVNDDPGRWKPTPPDYMEAIEPHWSTLRPFVLDSANQFNPGPPTAFDTISESPFYQETMHVYQVVNEIDKERLSIAKFWDCNPNISFTQGHVMYFQQQISPGGHWVHITAQVLESRNASTMESAHTLAKVCLTLADAFISCWDEKYRSSLTRPETYINRYIDPDWKPILQTPAFPEHTSGHSVASSSAATMLTSLYGDTFPFVDSTEVPFGLPTREFDSFYDASDEAAISRLYGGIHYMPAIEKGVEQGKQVGQFVISRLGAK